MVIHFAPNKNNENVEQAVWRGQNLY